MMLSNEYSILTKQSIPTSMAFEDMINEGLPATSIATLTKLLGTDKTSVAKAINLTVRRFDQMTKENPAKRLKKDTSERALLITRVFEKAKKYFGEDKAAQKWLNTPNLSLGGNTPLSTCQTFTGITLVQDLINRLEHGMTA